MHQLFFLNFIINLFILNRIFMQSTKTFDEYDNSVCNDLFEQVIMIVF